MSSSPANTNALDEVEPWFVVKVAVLALAIHQADSQKRRHSGAPSLRKWSAPPWWGHVGWRVLAAVILLAVSFVLGATR
jgi:hypothetical protein